MATQSTDEKSSMKRLKRSTRWRFTPLRKAIGRKLRRQKAVSGDSHLTPGILLPTTISASVHNGQSGSNKPPITVSLIRDFRPISPDQEMPQGPSERKKKRPKPLGTIEYQVVGSDTLESIAAQFDTTPSELAKLNKLPSRMIFPGQDIYVPDPNHDSGSELSVSPPQFSPPSPSPPTVDINKPKMDIPIVKMSDCPPVRYPGHVERQTSTSSQPEVTDFAARKLPEEEARELDKECYQRFIKVNVKHITDGQGVVNGVLLVTPNAIMFDPNVSDPLVIENGPEMYGMMAAMDTVISAAMYHDIAAMKLKGQPEERTDSPRPEIYHSSSCLYHQAEQAKKRCYKGNNSELINMIKTDRSESESSTGSDKCSCGANANTAKVHSEQLPRDVKSDQSEASIMSARSGMNQSDQSLSEMDLIQKEVRMLVNDVVKRAIESETRISGTSSDVSVQKIDSENNQISEPLHFVDDTFASSLEKESTLKHLQDNLKQLELESSECTFNSSGTGTLADASGETSLYTTCTAQLSANITDDSLLESPECIEKDSHQLSESQTEFVSTNDSGKNSESTPNHPNKMQIGSIQYFQYSSVDDNGLIIGPDGQPIALVRQPSKSDPIPMPDVNKGETNEGRSSSFGSFTSSPHISAFVNYATGLFRNTADDHKLVKDISEVPHVESVVDGNTGSQNSLVTKSEELESSDKHVAVKNAVKMGDMPGLFQSIDKLIPRPAARVEDPPLYLCLRVGRPLHQRVHSTGPIESYSRKKKKPEYWFSIPRDKVDQLYAFFVQWSPDKYGDEEDIDPASRGFVVVDEDDDVAEDEALDIFDEYFGPSTSARIHRDWEIVTKDEFRRRSIDVYEPLPLPELIGKSAILQEEHISLICRSLPGRAVGYPWTLVYSTETNGFSLKTLYRNMLGLEGPILLVVEDTSHNVFGALVACPLTISEHFYGTGESFLFTFYPEFDVFKWTGENNFFIKGNKDSLAIGAGKGQFGLWFDEDLYHGHSNRCETYDNDPLTSPEDFVLKGLEAWAFMV